MRAQQIDGKENIYDQLEDECNNIPNYDLRIVLEEIY